MKRPKSTIKSVFILICLFSFVLGGVFIGFERTFAQSSTTTQQSFQTNEQPSDQAIPGATPTGELQNQTYESTMKSGGGIWYIIGYIAGKILEFATGIVEWAIKFNTDVSQLDIVKTGWKVILNFANLGFVLAIIVIAFATILHIQSYAMKQTLWKLIIAALLVNFSLVIAGSLLDISNFATVLILEKINSGNIGAAFGSALQPQYLMGNYSKSDSSFFQKLSGILGDILNPFAFLLKILMSLVFVVIFTFLCILVLLTVFIMFMVRSAYIIFLLMLSPIVWLCWIFPATYKYWRQWWEKFIRWLIFAPASVFFIYLAIVAMSNSTTSGGATITQLGSVSSTASQAVNPNTALGAFSQSLSVGGGTGVVAGDFVAHFVKLFVFIIIIIGGLIVANSFGIAGGSVGVNLAEKAGNWTGRKGKQAGTWAFRKKWGKEEPKTVSQRLTEKAQKGGFLGKRVYGRLAKGAAGLERAGGQDIIKQAQKNIAGKGVNELIAMHNYANEPTRQAIEVNLAKSGDLDKLDLTKVITAKRKAAYERHNNAKEFSNIEKAAIMNVGMMEALIKKDQNALTNATNDYFSGLSPADWEDIKNKGMWKKTFSGKPYSGLDDKQIVMQAGNLIGYVAENRTATISNIIASLKKEDRDRFEEEIKYQIDLLRGDGKNEAADRAEEFLKNNIAAANLGINPAKRKKKMKAEKFGKTEADLEEAGEEDEEGTKKAA